MCEIDLSDGEPIEGYTSKCRKARKAHRCDICGGAILPKAVYTYRSGICDGEPFSEKCCDECLNDDKEFGNAHGYPGGVGGWLPVLLDECIQEREPGWEKWAALRERMRSRRAVADKMQDGL